jgi:hypothetical protein
MASRVEPYFATILALVSGGMSINSALASQPDFPNKANWKYYAYDRRFPERRERAEAANRAGKAARAGRGFAAKLQRYSEEDYSRSLLIIASSHAAVPMVDLTFDGVPGYTMLHRRSLTDPAFGKRFAAAKGGRKHGGRSAIYSEADLETAAAIIQSDGLDSYKRTAGGHLPCHSQLWKRAKRDPGFAAVYGLAVKGLRNRRQAERSSDNLYARVNGAVPSRMDPEARDDVISDIVEAVLAGRLAEDQITARCAEFVAAHNRMFSRFNAVSLDAPIFDDRSHSMLDNLTTDPACQWGM